MVLFWSFASWWMPLLVVMEIIYHHRFHLPVRYVPGRWSLVFTVSMYVVCTDHVGQVIHLPLVSDLAHVLAYPALIIWLLVFYGFVARVISRACRLW